MNLSSLWILYLHTKDRESAKYIAANILRNKFVLAKFPEKAPEMINSNIKDIQDTVYIQTPNVFKINKYKKFDNIYVSYFYRMGKVFRQVYTLRIKSLKSAKICFVAKYKLYLKEPLYSSAVMYRHEYLILIIQKSYLIFCINY